MLPSTFDSSHADSGTGLSLARYTDRNENFVLASSRRLTRVVRRALQRTAQPLSVAAEWPEPGTN